MRSSMYPDDSVTWGQPSEGRDGVCARTCVRARVCERASRRLHIHACLQCGVHDEVAHAYICSLLPNTSDHQLELSCMQNRMDGIGGPKPPNLRAARGRVTMSPRQQTATTWARAGTCFASEPASCANNQSACVQPNVDGRAARRQPADTHVLSRTHKNEVCCTCSTRPGP